MHSKEIDFSQDIYQFNLAFTQTFMNINIMLHNLHHTHTRQPMTEKIAYPLNFVLRGEYKEGLKPNHLPPWFVEKRYINKDVDERKIQKV